MVENEKLIERSQSEPHQSHRGQNTESGRQFHCERIAWIDNNQSQKQRYQTDPKKDQREIVQVAVIVSTATKVAEEITRE